MTRKITPEITEINFNNFGSIVYLLQLPNNNILIDTSSKENKEELKQTLAKLEISPNKINTIILTHAHYDHAENIDLFPNAKIYGNFTKIIRPDHVQITEKRIQPIFGSWLTADGSQLQCFALPGHTPGDIAILYKNVLFSGDIVFHGGYIGRNDFPESNPTEQKISLEKLSKLKFDILCPGH